MINQQKEILFLQNTPFNNIINLKTVKMNGRKKSELHLPSESNLPNRTYYH